MTLLQGKRLLLAVTGSIAAYKSVDLASKLTQAGAQVDVILTAAAQAFITPLTFEAVTGRPAYTALWESAGGGLPTHIAHVGLAEAAALLAVIPATANTLAKLAAGLADDLLTVTALAARCPLLVAPAMDGGMYAHPAVVASVQTLAGRGAYVVAPETGRFASGLSGQGRLPETATLLGHIRLALAQAGPLRGRQIVVTAGGTREAIDPVRFVSNHSSGKQGYALAQAALDAGATVTLISTVGLPVPVGAQFVAVDSAAAMLAAVLEHSARADALIMAAAVADFRPGTVATQKIKKQEDTAGLTLELVRNPDILLQVKAQREQTGWPRRVIGFAAESEQVLAHAQSKLHRKALDLLVANDITAPDAGFAGDTNRVILLAADGGQTPLPLLSKTLVSEAIIDRVAALLAADA
ncbi:MAG: bifunctional phosphopantothenoylcysteine decarboxylase/phosphopantothenate--cysteine ligase CoaBC [Anaerolineae bacterium]|nr:bifunctional phosphopantothenoylcysteine decarboxylase/phosphopantothenate--cysteine ligase CoaBC [Anaerolineae bacterium]